MKKNLSIFILIIEILSIAFLHGMKIKEEQKVRDYNNISKTSPTKSDPKSKSAFFFLKIK